MKVASLIILAGLCCLAAPMPVRADQAIATVQQALKDQGFYYGEVTGTKDADTTAAIRRYQIRNGLKITGELTAETQKSLGVHGSAAEPTATPSRTQRTVPPSPTMTPAPDVSDLRDDQPAVPGSRPLVPRSPEATPSDGYAPGPHGLYPATSGVFDGTPFEVAPIDVQRQALIGAQSRLAQLGYYRGAVDGAFGAGTAAALRTFQLRFSLAPNGRLDMETLAALGLLPGQRAPGFEAPRRRVHRSPRVVPGLGERIYIPR
jgi:peptidoglycan hydrolase-like protein with peptidoglycan-binding domain